MRLFAHKRLAEPRSNEETRGSSVTGVAAVAALLSCALSLCACSPDRKAAIQLNNAAEKKLHIGQFESAAQDLRRAIQLDPMIALFHSNLGYALRELKRFDEAVVAFATALRTGSGDNAMTVQAQVQLGISYRALGKRDLARQAFEFAAAKLPPGDGDPRKPRPAYWPIRALERLGEMARGEDDPERARVLWGRTIRAAAPFFSRLEIQDSVERKLVEDLKETALRTYQKLAWLYADHGDLTSARAVIENATAAPVRRAYLFTTLGYLYGLEALSAQPVSAADRLYQQAAEAYRKALGEHKNDAVALFGAGMSLGSLSPAMRTAGREEAMRHLSLYIKAAGVAPEDAMRRDLARSKLAELISSP